ncbi:TadE/TadG family type IV pilus assembly protein [Pendulispora albinea]|uniref:Pilus assembly protein n=1 Tax=Pendulispora albinea TaxID=2741071 RepID=A0ABZ2MBT5_9BACT
MSHTAKNNSRRAKTRQRGAAMVEAALVLPVMVSFLGFMYWFHDIGRAKMEAMQQVRGSVLTYASHGCSGQSGSDGSADGALSSSSRGQGAKDASGVSSKLNMVFNAHEEDARGVQAKGINKSAGSLRDTKTHHSACMCNERHVASGIAGMIGFAKQIFQERSFF